MSSINQKKYRIALFVGGLAYDGEFFETAINKMVDFDSNSVIKYQNTIDMKNYDIETNKFLSASGNQLIESTAEYVQISSQISSIVNLAKLNENKVILVKTKLDTFPYEANNGQVKYKKYDLIDNQALKIKKIIDIINIFGADVEIALVGHSQGGLVNLKASTLAPHKIKEIISISTPYGRSAFASILSDIEFIINIFNGSLVEGIANVDKNDIEYTNYNTSIDQMSSNTYLNNLKNAWLNLETRPRLTVIAGISIHMMTSQYYNVLFFPIEVNKRYPFDGLVFGKEQVDIAEADVYVLHNDGVDCYETSNHFNNYCCAETNLVHQHDCDCALPCFDISDVLFQSTIDLIKNLIHRGTNFSLADLPIVKAIIEGINGVPCSNERYRQYYELMGGNYSHKNIINQDDTVALILGILKS